MISNDFRLAIVAGALVAFATAKGVTDFSKRNAIKALEVKHALLETQHKTAKVEAKNLEAQAQFWARQVSGRGTTPDWIEKDTVRALAKPYGKARQVANDARRREQALAAEIKATGEELDALKLSTRLTGYGAGAAAALIVAIALFVCARRSAARLEAEPEPQWATPFHNG